MLKNSVFKRHASSNLYINGITQRINLKKSISSLRWFASNPQSLLQSSPLEMRKPMRNNSQSEQVQIASFCIVEIKSSIIVACVIGTPCTNSPFFLGRDLWGKEFTFMKKNIILDDSGIGAENINPGMLNSGLKLVDTTSNTNHNFKAFEKKVAKLQVIGRPLLKGVHASIVKQGNTNLISLDQVCRLLFENENSIESLFATRLLIHDQTFFTSVSKQGNITLLQPRDPDQVRCLLNAGYQKRNLERNAVIAKLRDIAESFRKGIYKAIPFTPQEQIFIELIKSSLMIPKSAIKSGPMPIFLNMIFDGVLTNSNRFDKPSYFLSAIKVLQETGFFRPCEDLAFYYSTVAGNTLSGYSKKSDQEYAKIIQNTNLNCHKKDSLADIRLPQSGEQHNHGESPVFVIDGDEAHELDDGISITLPDWIHVHIANPTAAFHSSDDIIEYAKKMFTSLYTPSRKWLSFPGYMPDLRNREQTLVFSARINADGSIAEYKVEGGRGGMEGKKRITRYADVNGVLDWKWVYGYEKKNDKTPWIARSLSEHLSRRRFNAISDKDAAYLKEMQRVLVRHSKWRIKQGAKSYNIFGVNLNVKSEKNENVDTRSVTTSSFCNNIEKHFANTRIHFDPYSSGIEGPSQVMVAEAMIIAGRVASAFCRANGIDVVYRGQEPFGSNLEKGPEAEMQLRGVLEEVEKDKCPESGVVSFLMLERMGNLFNRAYTSVNPEFHCSLGIRAVEDNLGGYVHISSPLRRFSDLLAHYQIQAHLVGEKPPFSKEEIYSFSLDAIRIEQQRKHLSSASTRFWLLEFLRRQAFNKAGSENYVANMVPEEIIPRPYQRIKGDYLLQYTAVMTKQFGNGLYQFTIPELGGMRFTEKSDRKINFGDLAHVGLEGVDPVLGKVRFKTE